MSQISVAIIDYQAGNLRSVAKAFEHCAAKAKNAIDVKVVASPEALQQASHIVLPGQGAFGDCLAGLSAIEGMVEALEERVITDGQPFFGICVGMQLLATEGHEFGKFAGLDWLGGQVVKMQPQDASLKIPHMGWNNLDFTSTGAAHPVLNGLTDQSQHAYFVHSFVFQTASPSDLLATCDYAGPLTAIVGRDNMFGTQFHPEKSQACGLTMIENFLAWKP